MFILFGGLLLLLGLLPKQPGAEESLAAFRTQQPGVYAYILVGAVLAVVCGVFMLRGHNWARWVLVVWFGYNVISKVVQSPLTLLGPGLLFAIIPYFLFRPQVSGFFHRTRQEVPQLPKTDGPRVG